MMIIKVIKFYDDYYLITFEAKNKTSGKGLKIITPKKLLQRLPIALAQLKADNNSENLLNKFRQSIYFLYQSKEITEKVYNNIIKLMQL